MFSRQRGARDPVSLPYYRLFFTKLFLKMKTSSEQNDSNFENLADQALSAMRLRAGELHITGVAVVAYSKGEVIESWISKMLVIGRLAGLPSEKDPAGANYLGIAYTKAAEMADTLKHSGSNYPQAAQESSGST